MLLSTLILTASVYTAQVPEPSPGEVKKVMEYFYNGSKPIVYDAYLCKTVERKAKETKNDCVERMDSEGQVGDALNVYMVTMVPQKTTATIMVQASHNGVVRSTRDIVLKGSWIRTRAWRRFVAKKPGTWTFKILNEDGDELRKMTFEAEASE